ncbi:MAG: hypothetical protein CMG07_06050 [Candidatus Marinimicrobia bacterium]|nr:hypothetical protein [Candidatus Neomarinimicrobiota bacterium]
MINKNKIIDKLKNYEIFNTVSENDFKNFVDQIKFKKIEANNTIIKENSYSDSLIFLVDGKISISRKMTLSKSHNAHQEKEILNTDSDSNPIFGEIGLFGNSHRRTATIRTTNECIIGTITKDVFFDICEKNNALGYKLLRNISNILSKRITDTNTNVMKLTTALCLILKK